MRPRTTQLFLHADAATVRMTGVRLGPALGWLSRATLVLVVLVGAATLLLGPSVPVGTFVHGGGAEEAAAPEDDFVEGEPLLDDHAGWAAEGPHAGTLGPSLSSVLAPHMAMSGNTSQDAPLFVDTWVGTGESTAHTAVASSTAWNERLGNTAPFVGTPFGMTHYTVESQRSTHKCIAPFYAQDSIITGFRLSHWLSGSCTQVRG